MVSFVADKLLNSESWKWAFEPRVPELISEKKFPTHLDYPWFLNAPPIAFIVDREYVLDRHQMPNKTNASAANLRHLNPIFTNIFTDISFIPNSIRSNKCTRFELSAVECYEYYGMRKGVDHCKDYFEDFLECSHNTKQMKRILAIRKQMNKRYLEYLAGKREYKDVYRSHPVPFAYYEPDHENEQIHR
eukprot:TRINITY_DN1141_c0_g1_i1.p1 TRINITY_DN1141_c0_g1~~TRINITY_DN1141_c0_g1_i1.p1  ORF type:complete len:206 (-),score=41.91 TRINITY_DN1141_c0_g1_i1:138-704(-)